MNVSAATVSCNLLSSYTDTPNAVCTISYGLYPNCAMYMDSSTPTTGSSGDTLTISLSQTLNSSFEYCYTVTLPNGGLILAVLGTFRSSKFQSVLTADGMVEVMCVNFKYNKNIS